MSDVLLFVWSRFSPSIRQQQNQERKEKLLYDLGLRSNRLHDVNSFTGSSLGTAATLTECKRACVYVFGQSFSTGLTQLSSPTISLQKWKSHL